MVATTQMTVIQALNAAWSQKRSLLYLGCTFIIPMYLVPLLLNYCVVFALFQCAPIGIIVEAATGQHTTWCLFQLVFGHKMVLSFIIAPVSLWDLLLLFYEPRLTIFCLRQPKSKSVKPTHETIADLFPFWHYVNTHLTTPDLQTAKSLFS